MQDSTTLPCPNEDRRLSREDDLVFDDGGQVTWLEAIYAIMKVSNQVSNMRVQELRDDIRITWPEVDSWITGLLPACSNKYGFTFVERWHAGSWGRKAGADKLPRAYSDVTTFFNHLNEEQYQRVVNPLKQWCRKYYPRPMTATASTSTSLVLRAQSPLPPTNQLTRWEATLDLFPLPRNVITAMGETREQGYSRFYAPSDHPRMRDLEERLRKEYRKFQQLVNTEEWSDMAETERDARALAFSDTERQIMEDLSAIRTSFVISEGGQSFPRLTHVRDEEEDDDEENLAPESDASSSGDPGELEMLEFVVTGAEDDDTDKDFYIWVMERALQRPRVAEHARFDPMWLPEQYEVAPNTDGSEYTLDMHNFVAARFNEDPEIRNAAIDHAVRMMHLLRAYRLIDSLVDNTQSDEGDWAFSETSAAMMLQ